MENGMQSSDYTVASCDKTVQHYNGKEINTFANAQRRDARYLPGAGRGQMTVRYPNDLNHTMKSCIDKIDEEHRVKVSTANANAVEDRTGWANIFSCCGSSAEELVDQTPAGESVVTDDESDSLSASSLDAFLDDINVATSAETAPTCASDEAMLLESAKRDSRLHDTSRRHKRYRGHPRSSFDSASGKRVGESPPLPTRRRSQRDSPTVGAGGTRRRRSNSKLRKSETGDNNYPWSSPSASGSLRRSRSRSGSAEVTATFSQSEENSSAVVGRRSRSHSRPTKAAETGQSAKVTNTGQNFPPLSPKIASMDEIAGLDMLIELQKQEAQYDKKLERKGSFRREKRRPKAKARKGVRSNSESSARSDADSSVRSNADISARPNMDSSARPNTDISVQLNTDNNVQLDTDSNPEEYTPSNKPQVVMKYMYGPRNGTYENVSTEEDIYGSEVLNTYCEYRLNLQFIKVVNRITFTLPLYHTISPTASFRGLKNVCSEPVASEFQVRGPTYMEDSVKIPSRETLFSFLGANNILRRRVETPGVSNGREEFMNKLRATCLKSSVQVPFILAINFIVPWGNFSSYYYRPDGTNGGPFLESETEQPSEKLWRDFLKGSEEYRKNKLKLIPVIVEGPWVLKKTVGQKPGIIGHKLPVKYLGSYEDGYLEICMDVTKGGKVANSICSACASKASIIAVDLAFLLQGDSREELPEQLLTVARLHHVQLKKGSLTYS